MISLRGAFAVISITSRPTLSGKRIGGDQDTGSIRIMLGLGKDIGSDNPWIGSVVRNNPDLAGPAGKSISTCSRSIIFARVT